MPICSGEYYIMATKAATKTTAKRADKKAAKKKDVAASYEAYKNYKGRQYTGMAIGHSHKWNYDAGVWRETKITPDRWELSFDVVKRRAGHAPEGSGVPVGTGYHWFILSHQYVEKIDANDYTTSMVGMKFKLAHKRANKNTWSASDETQRKHLIKILKDLVTELEEEPEKALPVPLKFEYRGISYEGVAIPAMSTCDDGICRRLDITLNKKHLGALRQTDKGWRITSVPQGLVNQIGEQVNHWYVKYNTHA